MVTSCLRRSVSITRPPRMTEESAEQLISAVLFQKRLVRDRMCRLPQLCRC